MKVIFKLVLFTLCTMTTYAEEGIIDPIRIEYLDPTTGEQFAMKPENTNLNFIITETLA